MKKRKALSLLLVVALTLGVMPMSQVTAEDVILDEAVESSVAENNLDNETGDEEGADETASVEAFETDANQEVKEDNNENAGIANSSELEGIYTDDFICDIQAVDGNEVAEDIQHGIYDGWRTNILENNRQYRFNSLTYGSCGYLLDVNFPQSGRAKILIEDCQGTKLENYFFRYRDFKSNEWHQMTYSKKGVNDIDGGWVSITAGRVLFRVDASPNREARIMVQYEEIGQYTGESEDNDTFDTANLIETNMTYEGNYSKGGDCDYYKFIMQKPGLAEINIATIRYEYDLYEEDVNGNVYKIVRKIESDKKYKNRVRLAEGNYFLVVKPIIGSSESTREYTLRINATYESPENYEQENNNVKSQANLKQTNHEYIGNMNTGEDVDCFKMIVTEPSFLSLVLRVPRQTEEGVLKISLYDETMEEVLLKAYNTENPYLQTEEILCPAGTYYVSIVPTWRYDSPFFDDYSFSLNQRPYKYVTSLSLPTTKTATEGTTFTLTPTITPNDAENKTLSWSSSNPYVATVDANGKVTAKAAGTTNITVTATDRNSVTAVCTLTVQKRVIKYVTGISLPANIRVENYETFSLAPVITPNDAENKALKWHSSNLDVAEVDQNGNVEKFGCGTARITVTAKDRNIVYASCLVTVYRKVEYKLNGGTNNSQNPATYSGGTISLKNPSRRGYIFKGWYGDKKYKRKVSKITASNIYYTIFYAKWEKVKVNKAKLSSVKAKSGKKAAVKYKAVSKAAGYEVVYSKDKKMKKNCISLKTKSKSVTLSGLTKGKTYYVKVRAYKTDSTGQAVYGKYSAVKKVKIKK